MDFSFNAISIHSNQLTIVQKYHIVSPVLQSLARSVLDFVYQPYSILIIGSLV